MDSNGQQQATEATTGNIPVIITGVDNIQKAYPKHLHCVLGGKKGGRLLLDTGSIREKVVIKHKAAPADERKTIILKKIEEYAKNEKKDGCMYWYWKAVDEGSASSSNDRRSKIPKRDIALFEDITGCIESPDFHTIFQDFIDNTRRPKTVTGKRRGGQNKKPPAKKARKTTPPTSKTGERLKWKDPCAESMRLNCCPIGRKKELIELHGRIFQKNDHLPYQKRVPLYGPSGMGKTTLANLFVREYKNDFPGGIIYIPQIGPIKQTAEHVKPLLRKMVDYAYGADAVQSLYGDRFNTIVLDEITDFVRDLLSMNLGNPDRRQYGPLLVVLDDIWTVEVLDVIEKALPSDCVVVLTTCNREVATATASKYGDSVIQEVKRLSIEDSIALVQHRVQRLKNDKEGLAEKLAKGLGCNPQALELATSVLVTRDDESSMTVINDILKCDADGPGFDNLLQLKKPVNATLACSYHCLMKMDSTGEYQKCFRALAVFAQEADFSTDAAAFVWQLPGGKSEALKALQSLRSLSLVECVAPAELGIPAQWQQHANYRAYGMKLQNTTDTNDSKYQWAKRHADYYLRLLENSCKPTIKKRQMDLVFKQIYSALNWCKKKEPTLLVRHIYSLRFFLITRGQYSTFKEYLKCALNEPQESKDKAYIYRNLGDVARKFGNYVEARGYLEEALKLAKNDEEGEADTHKSLGDLELDLELESNKDTFQVRKRYEKALKFHNKTCDCFGKATALESLGRLELIKGNLETASSTLNESLELFKEYDDPLGIANVLLVLSDLNFQKKEIEEARRNCEDARKIYDDVGNGLGKANSLLRLGDLELHCNNNEAAQRLLKEAHSLYTAQGHEKGKATALDSLGKLCTSKDAAPPQACKSGKTW